MSRKLTTEEFILKARKIHGNKYQYNKTKYETSHKKVLISCNIANHEDFLQTPNSHLNGSGCPLCGQLFREKSKTKSTEDFISEAKKIHGQKYDYSKSIYKSAKEKLTIICPIHKEFQQTPNEHLYQASGCMKCGGKSQLSTEEFIEKSRKIHGNKFDYSKSKYLNIHEPIIIICPIHGEFYQSPNNHMRGFDCNECGQEQVRIKKTLTIKEFLAKAKEVHGDSYDYSAVKYKKSNEKIKIKCKIHEYFFQTPASHLMGHGCPKCAFKGEGRIASYLVKNLILYREYKIQDRKYDFYLPEYNLLIERDGEQHYKNVPHFKGSNRKLEKDLAYQTKNDKHKTKLAKKEGFKIARIPYWLTKKEEEIEIENILAGKPTYPDVPDLKQEKTKPRPKKNY